MGSGPLLCFNPFKPVCFSVDDAFHDDAHDYGREDINNGVLFYKCRRKADDDGAEYDENLKRRRRCFFLQPGGRDADGIGNVKGRTDTGICIYGVEKSDKGSQRVVPWKLRRPEILTAGEKNVDCHGNHLG